MNKKFLDSSLSCSPPRSTRDAYPIPWSCTYSDTSGTYRFWTSENFLAFGRNKEEDSMEEDLERLILAARSGDLEEVKRYTKLGNLNKVGPLGMTVLGEACRAGQIAVVRFLLEAGADIGDVLHLACEYKDVHMVKVLVTSNVPLDTVDKYGKTPLLLAAERQSVVLVEELLKHGASVNKVDRHNCQSPLHIACETECLDVVTSLLAAGALTNLKDKSSLTPLHIACLKNNSVDVMISLLKHQANIDDEDYRYGDTPLHLACERGRLDMVRLLLQHGASVNITNRRCLTPLHLAVDHDPIVSTLLDYGSGSEQCATYFCPCKSTVLQCMYEFHHSTSTSVDVFEKHFIKADTAKIDYLQKLKWHPKDSDGWGQLDRESFMANCLEEIEKLKMHKIGDSNCSYNDLLTRKKSALYNEKIIGCVSADVVAEFPIYGDMIYCCYLMVPKFLKRRKLVRKSTSFFGLTQFSQLPPELVPLILEYLPDEDLKHLAEISEKIRLCSGSMDASEFKTRSNSHQLDSEEVVDALNAMSLRNSYDT